MADDQLERVLKQKLREAGRQIGEAKRAYRRARRAARAELPHDDAGRARIVCRRYAERRRVTVDPEGRPACFDASAQDCQGCAEDIRAGDIETW
jgi:hypothetical protein